MSDTRAGYSPAARRFLRGEVMRRPWTLSIFVMMSVVAAIIEMTGVGLVFPLLLIVADPTNIDRIPFLGDAANALGFGEGNALYGFLIALIAVIMVSKNVFMGSFQFLQMRFLARWKLDLSRRLMRIYLFHDFRIHMEKTSSEIIRNVSLTSSVVEHFVLSSINIAISIAMACGLVLILLFALPPEAMIGTAVLFCTVAAIYFFTRRTIVAIGRDSNEIFKQRQRLLQQSIGAIRDTKILGKEAYFVERFANVEGNYFDKQRRYNFLTTLPPLILESVVILSVLALIAYILLGTTQQSVALASLGLLAAAMFRLMPQLNRVLTGLQMLNLGRDALEIVANELDHYERTLDVPSEEAQRLPMRHALTLRGVSYTYPGASAPSLLNVDLDIRRGEFIGITGQSGAGKSTLLSVILGLVEPTAGQARVDGTPLSGADVLRSWQANIGMVPQSIFLFDESTARNIAFGVPDERVDRSRVDELVDLVHLRPAMERLENGIDESVGEYGSRLSAGERQRVGIARALYRDPEFLAFDEATSSLDVAIEKSITDEISGLRGNKTIVAIAHRLSTLKECDRIIMIESGNILDIGSFEELQARCAAFRRLVNLSAVPSAAE